MVSYGRWPKCPPHLVTYPAGRGERALRMAGKCHVCDYEGDSLYVVDIEGKEVLACCGEHVKALGADY